ncbi:UDP-2,3-diacylglucosamine diphosphatase [Dysgonomonas sp. ZJ709]|uniref:UDP-2,3-diacylglucosamine diphosphatase n=1 Tax=Dysgonomonas sp. ZJ709 TaxID=2709797 RepID=UPI0013EAEF26|nr:UDP-2,3-diacylglucosamine diphosphatase [Dysgonomonas sp. ZJ709]
MKKKIYFLSDVHLGSAYHRKHVNKDESVSLASKGIDIDHYAELKVEQKLCRWLDMVKQDAKAIYLLGDIFDYWFEYKNVVPRGYTRFLGKIAEITDSSIEVHFFIGNHDIWLTDYLQNECGMIIHREALTTELLGKKFFLAHGDGLGDDSRSFKLLRKLFHSSICRIPFAAIHPRWTVGFAHWWSNHNRSTGEMPDYMGEDKEHLVLYAKEELKTKTDINFFIFGHRHIMLDLMLSQSGRIVILGDWLRYFSYGVWDGENFVLDVYEE